MKFCFGFYEMKKCIRSHKIGFKEYVNQVSIYFLLRLDPNYCPNPLKNYIFYTYLIVYYKDLYNPLVISIKILQFKDKVDDIILKEMRKVKYELSATHTKNK